MNINSDIPFLERSNIFDVWKFPIIHVNTSMFNNTLLGHCRLLQQMLFRRSGSELFHTITNIILLRIFPLQNIYLSRPGIIDARARYRAAARRLGNTALGHISLLQGVRLPFYLMSHLLLSVPVSTVKKQATDVNSILRWTLYRLHGQNLKIKLKTFDRRRVLPSEILLYRS
jgi:hypothetical protein